MSWESAMNDLANSWKVGIAFVVLVAIRVLLTSQAESLARMRAAVFGGLAGLFGGDRPATHPNSMPSDANSGGAVRPQAMATRVLDPLAGRGDALLCSGVHRFGLIALVLVFAIIRPFVVQAFYIPSGSMRPTLVRTTRSW